MIWASAWKSARENVGRVIQYTLQLARTGSRLVLAQSGEAVVATEYTGEHTGSLRHIVHRTLTMSKRRWRSFTFTELLRYDLWNSQGGFTIKCE